MRRHSSIRRVTRATGPQDFLVSINPESLLLEGAHRVDEWSLIEKKIPSFDLVFEIDRTRVKESVVELTPERERLGTEVRRAPRPLRARRTPSAPFPEAGSSWVLECAARL